MPFGTLPERYEPPDGARGLAMVLPGRNYSPAAPLLEFARLALLQHGYALRQVWWDAPWEAPPSPSEDPQAWVRRQLEAALEEETWSPVDRRLLVGKSLGTRAASYAAEHGLDAVWLTPLLTGSRLRRGHPAERGPPADRGRHGRRPVGLTSGCRSRRGWV